MLCKNWNWLCQHCHQVWKIRKTQRWLEASTLRNFVLSGGWRLLEGYTLVSGIRLAKKSSLLSSLWHGWQTRRTKQHWIELSTCMLYNAIISRLTIWNKKTKDNVEMEWKKITPTSLKKSSFSNWINPDIEYDDVDKDVSTSYITNNRFASI